MAELTGLFSRGSSYYLRVMLPINHAATQRYRSGKIILSLGSCSRRDAVAKGLKMRADILSGLVPEAASPASPPTTAAVRQAPATPTYLRDVYDKWVTAKARSDDTLAACKRALVLFEEQTGNLPLHRIARAAGVEFRAWLLHPDRKTTSKTARDRLTWVKSLLKFAQIDLEVIARSPWEGLDIEQATTHKRRPWTADELSLLFGQALHSRYALPTDKLAGDDAAYWIPLLGLYTGARVGELAQLRCEDIRQVAGFPVLVITDESAGQHLKTSASQRQVPIHSELLRLGLLDYVGKVAEAGAGPLWPSVRVREGKAGGYFSQWFGIYRRGLGFGKYPDFHCLRHTVRSALACADVSEPMIDQLIGHEIKGSTGAKTYTHRTMAQMNSAIEKLSYPALQLERVYPVRAST